MWTRRQIENTLQERLLDEFGTETGNRRWAEYTSARDSVIDEIASHIAAFEPNLSDHGPRHLANVMDNAYRLLGDRIADLTALELYCLLLIIVFHDVGNIFGREAHQERIAEIYSDVRPDEPRFRQERRLIHIAGAAHTGLAKDHTTNTLRDVTPLDHLYGEPIRLRDLSAILRLADELAEGPQRTSHYRYRKGMYAENSEIYHEYANITNIHIDRGNGRVALTYHIELGGVEKLNDETHRRFLLNLLDFTYQRVIKLDTERKYTKHYCDFLSPFKQTTVTFNFWSDNIQCRCGLDLAELVLNDLVLPGESEKNFAEMFPQCEPNRLLPALVDALKARGDFDPPSTQPRRDLQVSSPDGNPKPGTQPESSSSWLHKLLNMFRG